MRMLGKKISDLFLKDMSLLFPVNTKIPADMRWKTPPRAGGAFLTSHPSKAYCTTSSQPLQL